ncbi:glycosyltransferase family 2 protein [Tropicimonas sp. IMCC34043]|uniref:glycosyltransferase family 2 protein n=1 Tax=Tropicimonas sp. IMCC34043 TaxID=2248760 RepID=UPI000E277F54|nr:glycosyltransferase family 2 protein [Tropicimonas sp. IMCC34043]
MSTTSPLHTPNVSRWRDRDPHFASAAPGRLIAGGRGNGELLGQRLVENGAIDPGDLVKALALQARQDTRLGNILLSNNMVSERALMDALCDQWGTGEVDLDLRPADPRLVDAYGATRCLREGLLPWRREGSTVVVATSRPEKFLNHRSELEQALGSVSMALTSEATLHRALTRVRNPALAQMAETRVPAAFSCRNWDRQLLARRMVAATLVGSLIAAVFPVAVFSLLAIWAIVTLAATAGLKLIAAGYAVHQSMRKSARMFQTIRRRGPDIARLPTVSILVPLLQEEDIADKLIGRLSRQAYPKELMDVLLVVEEHDERTAEALSRTRLPHWIRVVTVPEGGVKTKPRALNYALEFCRGQIVGVWDAEDAPDADQLHKVVRRFHERGPEVACLQGVLDYYNARTNWLSRCFTIEYASWFRVLLPGLQRMGMPVPLGGTTLFFRRAALEKIGGWDAHNVTEDADLGMRLVRMGYRTEIIDTVTKEEANCRVRPWITQRSRWLKGYAMTWSVHMRDPGRLWRELGPRGFLGFQILFLGTLTQFILAPVLWSFWLLALGLPHPLASLIPGSLLLPLMGLFALSELVNLGTAAFAVRGREHRFLTPWVLTLGLYFPLAALASYKAFYELSFRPFHWHKTCHGLYDEAEIPVFAELAIA